jgi:hypothetical protein
MREPNADRDPNSYEDQDQDMAISHLAQATFETLP